MLPLFRAVVKIVLHIEAMYYLFICSTSKQFNSALFQYTELNCKVRAKGIQQNAIINDGRIQLSSKKAEKILFIA